MFICKKVVSLRAQSKHQRRTKKYSSKSNGGWIFDKGRNGEGGGESYQSEQLNRIYGRYQNISFNMEKHSLVGCMFCVCCNGNFHASAWRTVIHCMGWHLILWRRWTFRVISHTERKNNPHTILYDYGRWHHHEQEFTIHII